MIEVYFCDLHCYPLSSQYLILATLIVVIELQYERFDEIDVVFASIAQNLTNTKLVVNSIKFLNDISMRM